MADFENAKHYSFSDHQLEQNILFWQCAEDNDILTVAKNLNAFLDKWNDKGKLSPFQSIRSMVDKTNVPLEIKNFAIKDHNEKAIVFILLAFSGINLRTCSFKEFLKVKGLKNNVVKCFLIHTRQLCVEDYTYEISSNKPETKKTINSKEQKSKDIIDNREMLDFDLSVWNIIRKNK